MTTYIHIEQPDVVLSIEAAPGLVVEAVSEGMVNGAAITYSTPTSTGEFFTSIVNLRQVARAGVTTQQPPNNVQVHRVDEFADLGPV